MVKFVRFITVLVLFGSSSLHSEKAESISFDFRVFGIGKDNYEGLFYFNGSDFEPLQFHRTHRSVKKYSYRGTLPFGIFVRNPNHDPDEPNSAEFVRIAKSAPILAKDQLIVLAADPNNRDSLDVQRRFMLFHLDDSLDTFGRNTIVLLNATGANLFGRVDGKDMSLPMGNSDPIPYKPTSGKSTTRIAFALATKDGARLVMSNDLELSNNRRVIIILEPPRRENSFRVAVRVLSESIFPEEAEDN